MTSSGCHFGELVTAPSALTGASSALIDASRWHTLARHLPPHHFCRSAWSTLGTAQRVVHRPSCLLTTDAWSQAAFGASVTNPARRAMYTMKTVGRKVWQEGAEWATRQNQQTPIPLWRHDSHAWWSGIRQRSTRLRLA